MNSAVIANPTLTTAPAGADRDAGPGSASDVALRCSLAGRRHPAALVTCRNRAYVMAEIPQRSPVMPGTAVSPMPMRFRPAVWAGVGIVGVLTAATVLLWAHYGSAVFFEMIMAGIAACF